jgi:hypothetical protein
MTMMMLTLINKYPAVPPERIARRGGGGLRQEV